MPETIDFEEKDLNEENALPPVPTSVQIILSRISPSSLLQQFQTQRNASIQVQALLTATQNGDLLSLKKYLRQNPETDLNQFHVFSLPNNGGKASGTLLHLACLWGQKGIVAFLYKHHLINNDLRMELISDLLGNMMSANALWCALFYGHDEVAAYLINEGIKLNTPGTSKGFSILHVAVLNNCIQSISNILDRAPEFNYKRCTIDGSLPIHFAAEGDHHTLQHLLDHRKTDPDLCRLSDKDYNIPLHRAAEKGSVSNINILLNKANNINQANTYSQTPLIKAIRKQNTKVVHTLIKQGADVNAKDTNNATSLHHAAKQSDWVILQSLLDAGAKNLPDRFGATPFFKLLRRSQDIADLFFNYGQPLDPQTEGSEILSEKQIAACIQQINNIYEERLNPHIKNYLVEQFKRTNNKERLVLTFGRVGDLCCLSLAIQEELMKGLFYGKKTSFWNLPSFEEVKQDLFSSFNGPDLMVAFKDEKKIESFKAKIIKNPSLINKYYVLYTPVGGFFYEGTLLHLACQLNNISLVKFLVAQNINLDSPSFPSYFPMGKAAQHRWPALYWSLYWGHDEVAAFLIEQGADYEQEIFGHTTLTLAVEKNCQQSLMLLLEKISEEHPTLLNTADSYGYTPLLHAANKKNDDLVLLLTYNADINAGSSLGITVLHLAAQIGNLVQAEIVIKKEPALITSKDAWGATPLLYAAMNESNQEMLGFLIEQKADINAMDYEKQNILHITAKLGNIENIKYILSKEPNLLNQVNGCKSTALHYACLYNHQDVVVLLIAHGVKINETDLCGQTPFEVALLQGHCGIADLLFSTVEKNNFSLKKELSATLPHSVVLHAKNKIQGISEKIFPADFKKFLIKKIDNCACDSYKLQVTVNTYLELSPTMRSDLLDDFIQIFQIFNQPEVESVSVVDKLQTLVWASNPRNENAEEIQLVELGGGINC